MLGVFKCVVRVLTLLGRQLSMKGLLEVTQVHAVLHHLASFWLALTEDKSVGPLVKVQVSGLTGAEFLHRF